MSPTILVVGATGNTGTSVVSSLPKLLESSKTKYRVLGLTRSLKSPASQSLSSLPNVEMQEKDWTTIDADWLKANDVTRVFIASHNMYSQFSDESTFLVALLKAGIKYVVRISTIQVATTAASPVYYGRTHWAIENLLEQPEFSGLQWTSLRPTFYHGVSLAAAIGWTKYYQQTGQQVPLAVFHDQNTSVSSIDPRDVGEFAAQLLALDDPTPHHRAKYVLSGPGDLTGDKIIQMVEEETGTKIESTKFRDVEWIGAMVAQGYPESARPSFEAMMHFAWDGKISLATLPNSDAVLKLAAPKRTYRDAFKEMLNAA